MPDLQVTGHSTRGINKKNWIVKWNTIQKKQHHRANQIRTLGRPPWSFFSILQGTICPSYCPFFVYKFEDWCRGTDRVHVCHIWAYGMHSHVNVCVKSGTMTGKNGFTRSGGQGTKRGVGEALWMRWIHETLTWWITKRNQTLCPHERHWCDEYIIGFKDLYMLVNWLSFSWLCIHT